MGEPERYRVLADDTYIAGRTYAAGDEAEVPPGRKRRTLLQTGRIKRTETGTDTPTETETKTETETEGEPVGTKPRKPRRNTDRSE